MPTERLDRIEERIAWLERHVVAQDKAMLELAEENRRLRDQLAAMRDRLAAGGGGAGDAEPEEGPPPHY